MVSQRKKRSRQETLEASSFTVVAAIKEKAAADEGEEGVNGDAKALLDTTATVPFKFKQVKLADFYITSTKAAAAKEDAHREKVKAARKGKKKSKDPATSSKVGALAGQVRAPGWPAQQRGKSRRCCARAQGQDRKSRAPTQTNHIYHRKVAK